MLETSQDSFLVHIVGSQDQHNMLETSQDNLLDHIVEHIREHIVESQEQQTIVG